jgi:hypothetical protein
MSLQKYKNSSCFNGFFQMKKSELNKELKKLDQSIPVSKLTKPQLLCNLMKFYEKQPQPPSKSEIKPQPPSEPRPTAQPPLPKISEKAKDIPQYMKDDVNYSNALQEQYYLEKEIIKDREYFNYKKTMFLNVNQLSDIYDFSEKKETLKNKFNIDVSTESESNKAINELFDKTIKDKSRYDKYLNNQKRLESLKSEIQTLRKEWFDKYDQLQIYPSFQYKASLNEYYNDITIDPNEKHDLYKNLYEEAVKYYPLIFVNYDPTKDYLDVKYTIKPQMPVYEEEDDKQISQQIKDNLKFIDELEKKGKLNNFPSYKGWHFLQYILTIVFSEKYNTLCPLISIQTESKTSDGLNESLETYAKQAGDCIKKGEKVLIIPLSMPRHENMVIIKVDTREVVRFEPHGEGTHPTAKGVSSESKVVDKYLKEYTKQLNIYLNLKETPFRYIAPEESCPRISSKYRKGFQTLEGLYKKESSESGGYCQLWSFFFAECVITNPDMPINMVYKYALEALRDDPERARMIIRGYFHEINEKLKEFSGVIFNYIKNIPQLNRKYDQFFNRQNVLIIDYINKKKEILAGKPDVFKGRGKKDNYKFILPKSIYSP